MKKQITVDISSLFDNMTFKNQMNTLNLEALQKEIIDIFTPILEKAIRRSHIDFAYTTPFDRGRIELKVNISSLADVFIIEPKPKDTIECKEKELESIKKLVKPLIQEVLKEEKEEAKKKFNEMIISAMKGDGIFTK